MAENKKKRSKATDERKEKKKKQKQKTKATEKEKKQKTKEKRWGLRQQFSISHANRGRVSASVERRPPSSFAPVVVLVRFSRSYDLSPFFIFSFALCSLPGSSSFSSSRRRRFYDIPAPMEHGQCPSGTRSSKFKVQRDDREKS